MAQTPQSMLFVGQHWPPGSKSSPKKSINSTPTPSFVNRNHELSFWKKSHQANFSQQLPPKLHPSRWNPEFLGNLSFWWLLFHLLVSSIILPLETRCRQIYSAHVHYSNMQRWTTVLICFSSILFWWHISDRNIWPSETDFVHYSLVSHHCITYPLTFK